MHHYFAAVLAAAVLEEIDALPCPECQACIGNRYAERALGEGGSDMRRHVVWSFVSMDDPRAAFRNDPPEKFHKVALHLFIGILLYEERRRSVPAEQREQARPHTAHFDESFGFGGEFIEPLPLRCNREPFCCCCMNGSPISVRISRSR